MLTDQFFMGIDIGTTSVKTVLIDVKGQVCYNSSQSLKISHPQPRWAEQDPEEWWSATKHTVQECLKHVDPLKVCSIGLSGQQHGAVLLDECGRVLRPAIIWCDGRSDMECCELEKVPNFRRITGNMAMPGFTAPKLLWVRKHEPDVFAKVSMVLLPKDYIRYRMTGTYMSDASDASGTLWLNMQDRQWSDEILAACGLSRSKMPIVCEGFENTGVLTMDLEEQWGMYAVPVAGGGSDNAAGAVSVGVIRNGQAMLSLGTSGVYFAVCSKFCSAPDQAVHAFCHVLHNTWHVMSVTLNAGCCLEFTARNTGYRDVECLMKDAEKHGLQPDGPLFLPYLNGERTPYNDVHLRASFTGLGPQTQRADLANATLEGIGLSLLDGLLAVESAGVSSPEIYVIGGGSRSPYWIQMLSNILGKRLITTKNADLGPALGAALLGRMAYEPSTKLEDICFLPEKETVHEPDVDKHSYFRNIRHPLFRRSVKQVKSLYNSNL